MALSSVPKAPSQTGNLESYGSRHEVYTRRRGVAALATAVASAVGLEAIHALPANAANGDPLLLGQTNSASSSTILEGSLQVQSLHADGEASAGRVLAGSGAGPTTSAAVVGMGQNRGVFGYASSLTDAIAVDGIGRSIGVRGQGFVGSGVLGIGGSTGVTGTGDVYGVSGSTSSNNSSAAGVKAENTGGGFALLVSGKVQLSTAGKSSVGRQESAAAVASSAITANSHVMVTLSADPGASTGVEWVEVIPGTGFVVHLSAKAHNDTPFTYLIVELPA